MLNVSDKSMEQKIKYLSPFKNLLKELKKTGIKDY